MIDNDDPNGYIVAGYGEARLLTRKCLSARGWSEGMIRALLGQHDHRGLPNDPRTALYWRLDRVVEAELTDEFRRARHASRNRSVAARARVDSGISNGREILARVAAREQKINDQKARARAEERP